LIQASPDGITFSDLRGNLITANEQAAHMYGCDSVEELMNSASTAFDFVAPEDRQRALQNAKRTFDEGVLRNLEYKLIRKDGSTYPVELSASTVKDADGKPMGFVGVIRDITKRKRTEQERMRLQEQFQHAQKMESLGILAGGIAHDFNNLLMGILGNAGLACMDLPEGSPARHSVEQIEKAGRAAADLINQMLAYSGKGHFVVEPVNMSRLVEEMTGLLKVSVSKKIDLKFDFDRDIPAVEADASQLRQVIMNLITNASEAIEDQPGVVSVRTGIMETTREFFSKTYTRTDLPEGTYVYLEVSDSGCGMDNETLGRIFDPFFSTKFTGRGLGLAAVLGIVRGHNGAIRVKSELGQGTTIKVVFPPCETQDYQPAHEKTETSTAEHSGTILVVDDEVTVRDVSERMLRNSGFDVITARDGMEALEKFRNHTDEIVGVLLDATMPGMDGPQTFENLRHIREDIRVILSSGYNEQEATERFADKGLAGFIQKPYRINELIDIIDEVLD